MANIGLKLRNLRKEHRKTLRQVQDETGLSFSNIAEIERGEHSITIDTLKVLAAYYGVSLDYFYADEDVKTTSLSGQQLALYNGTKDLSDEQVKEILNFIDYVKNKK